MNERTRTFRVKLRGSSPLIMHNVESADPLNPFTIEAAPIKNKRSKKTVSDIQKLHEIQFLASLYWSSELNSIYMPVENLRKMLLEAARGCDQRGAKKQIVGIAFHTHLGFPIETPNCSDLNALKNDPSLRYKKIVTVAKAKVSSTRAIFKTWAFELEIDVDAGIVDPSIVEEWFRYGGRRVGLGSRRPYAPTPGEFGKFIVEEFEEVQ